MAQPEFLNLTGKQDLEGVMAVMNCLLQPQGITAKAEQENQSLYVLLESEQVPDQQTMIALVHLAINSIVAPTFTALYIYGRQFGDPFTAWSHTALPLLKGLRGMDLRSVSPRSTWNLLKIGSLSIYKPGWQKLCSWGIVGGTVCCNGREFRIVKLS